jgi:dihydroflavonol-4-reductase
VLVTGGTGYVGSHTVAALVEGGHEVRLLVRDPRRVSAALTPLGLQAANLATIVGDVTDPAAVDQAVRDCEAVVHAGSVYSLDSRDARRIRQVNVRGTDLVLGTAHRAGLDPIVYVSSVAALLQPNGQTLTPDSPIGRPPGPYLRAKADAERVARRYQEAGAPVVTTYPGGVLAPTTPAWEPGSGRRATSSRAATRSARQAGFRLSMCAMWPRSMPRVLAPGRRPRRYMASGTFLRFADLVVGFAAVTGRRLPTITLPAQTLLPVARVARLMQHVTPVHIPVEFEGAYLCRCANRCDDTKTRQELGVTPCDLEVTLADSVRWLVAHGHISGKQAGQLATA